MRKNEHNGIATRADEIKILSYVDLIDADTMTEGEITEEINMQYDGDYLTEQAARDGKAYLWYDDGAKQAFLDLDNHEIINFDEAEVDRLFC